MTTTTPRVSVLLLAYNQAAHVRRAVLSCLAQDCEPLEVILSDDASSDRTFELMQELAAGYRGPHRVTARRNAGNVGIGEHYNQLVAASSGALLVTAAGDDISTPDRVRRLIEAWEATGCRADLIASHVIDLDDDDQLHAVMRVDDLSAYRGAADWARKRPYIIGAGHAFTRRMMERFGPIAPGVFYEDQVMVFRAIVSGGAVTVDAPLVHYRRGGTSRKPPFESQEHMKQWTLRQLGRELAEMHQLLADAQLANRLPEVREHIESRHVPARYQQLLQLSLTSAERWAAFRDASTLPYWWRLRKMMHVVFPRTSYLIRRTLYRLHEWRFQHGIARRQHDPLP